MRQRGDLEFIPFLNKIRVGIVDYAGEKILLSRFIAKDNPAYPKHALHMFAENKLKVGAQVLLTINIDLEDRLVNGLVGKVTYLRYVNDEVKVIYMKFNDQNTVQQAIQSDIFARQRNWVPIQKYETTFPIKKINYSHQLKELNFH